MPCKSNHDTAVQGELGVDYVSADGHSGGGRGRRLGVTVAAFEALFAILRALRRCAGRRNKKGRGPCFSMQT